MSIYVIELFGSFWIKGVESNRPIRPVTPPRSFSIFFYNNCNENKEFELLFLVLRDETTQEILDTATDTANVEFIKINYERRWNYLGIRSNRFVSQFSNSFRLSAKTDPPLSDETSFAQGLSPLILFQSFLDKETPSILKFISGWDTWYIWGRGVFRGVEAFEVSKFEMSTQVFRDRWNVEASDIARSTHNPIRSIVESLVVEPNPAKSLISLSIGEIFLFYACVREREFYFTLPGS